MGVRDDGTVIGLDNADSVSLQISNMVRDAIKPDITVFLHYETIVENGKNYEGIRKYAGKACD
jgi:ATP-dependent DNA helicase RecG